MSAPQIEPELLAAVLDGTASPVEREAVMRQVAGSKLAYAEFLEASAVRRELYSEESELAQPSAPSSESVEIRPRRWRRRYLAPIAMLAAASVVFVLSTSIRSARSSAIAVAQSTRIPGATGTGSLTRVLGEGWDSPGWSVTRGAEPTREASARAFRSGVRFAQLEVAVSARDSAAVGNAVRQLQQLLNDVLGSAPLSAQLGALSTGSEFGATAARSELAHQLQLMLGDPNWFDLGTWTGAAILAAKSGQDAFFAADSPAIAELASLAMKKFEPTELWSQTEPSVRAITSGEWRDAGGRDALLTTLTKIVSAAAN